jgi:hypothetical protein
LWRHPDGRLFAAGRADLLVSDDGGCSWTATAGDLAGQPPVGLAFDGLDPQRIWALAGEPAVLYRSLDGGAHFSRQHAFPAGYGDPRLLAAGGARLYLTAATVGATTVLERSGRRWRQLERRELTAGIAPPPRNPLTGLAVAPIGPTRSPSSSPIRRAISCGRPPMPGGRWFPSLHLREGEVLAGFTFGATAASVYVAGTAPIRQQGRAPARLYHSDDGGATWADPVPSDDDGPLYRCLAFREGALLACGAGESAGDRFLLGRSEDGGRSWSPVVHLADLAGARACVRARCAATEQWLCDVYGRCAEAQLDAGASDGPGPDAAAPQNARAIRGGGCACRVGATDSSAPPLFCSGRACMPPTATSRPCVVGRDQPVTEGTPPCAASEFGARPVSASRSTHG